MGTRRVTDELAERARSMRADGATYHEIKAAIGVGSLATISKILGTAGTGQARPRIAPEVREKARALRVDGMSVPEISRELGIARSTAWQITKDIAWTPGPDSASRRAEAGRRYWRAELERRDGERMRTQDESAAFVGALTDREVLLLGAAVYWAEGTKAKPWRRRERLVFVNSDPDMIVLFLAWLKVLDVSPDQLTYRVHIHESADVAAAECYWAAVVDVPVENFARSTLKRHTPKTVRKNVGADYHGCLVVTVRKSVDAYRKMAGLWSGISSAIERRSSKNQAPMRT